MRARLRTNSCDGGRTAALLPPLVLLGLLVLIAGSACGSGHSGGKIAFSAPVDGVYRLMIANADGSGEPTVAPGPMGVQYPSWSPDGSKIVFGDSDSVSTYISVVRADGSHYARVFDDQNTGSGYSWSGTSDQLAIGSAAILIRGADGGGRRKLVDGYFPSWSPDGRMVAFVRGPFLRVINSDGTADRKLFRLGFVDGCFDILWSSDSRKIACSTPAWKNPKTSCESSGDCNYVDPATNTRLCLIHIIDVRGSSHVQVVGGGLLGSFGFQCEIAWSPDGRRVAFTRNGYIYSVTADGRREQRLARGFVPSWSPDGSHLAFLRNETTYVLDVGRHVERRLGRATQLSWSPDGKTVVIGRIIKEQVQADQGGGYYQPGEYVIETIDTDNGHTQRIWPKEGTCDCFEAAWQP